MFLTFLVPVRSHVGATAASSGVVPTTDAKRNRVGGTRYYDLALQCPEVKEYVRLVAPVNGHLVTTYLFGLDLNLGI